MSNPSYNTLLTTTIESRTRDLADLVTKNVALLMRLKKRGNAKVVTGGVKILQEVEYAENPNFGWYSGYDTLAVAPSEIATAAEFAIKEAYCGATISGLEQAQNQGRERMIELTGAKIRNAEKTMVNAIGAAVYGDGTAASGKAIGGLQFLVSFAPATGTVGGINRATNPYWRNRSTRSGVDFGEAATPANILSHMGRVYNPLVRGTDKPDFIAADNNSYQLFTDAMTDRQVVTSTEMAEAGFTALKFRGADVLLDGGMDGSIPADTMYFLNTDYLFYRPIQGHDMYPLRKDVEKLDQDSVTSLIGWKGNMTTSGPKFQAVHRIN